MDQWLDKIEAVLQAAWESEKVDFGDFLKGVGNQLSSWQRKAERAAEEAERPIKRKKYSPTVERKRTKRETKVITLDDTEEKFDQDAIGESASESPDASPSPAPTMRMDLNRQGRPATGGLRPVSNMPIVINSSPEEGAPDEGDTTLIDPLLLDPEVDEKKELARDVERLVELYALNPVSITLYSESSVRVAPEGFESYIRCFAYGEWLLSEPINLVISSFAWRKDTLVLPSDVTQHIANGSKPWPTDKWRPKPHHKTMVVPVCFGSHWTLFKVDLESELILRYNSLSSTSGRSSGLEDKVTAHLADITKSNLKMSSSPQSSEQQSNSSDCGIFTIWNAECIARGPRWRSSRPDPTRLRRRYLNTMAAWVESEQSEATMVGAVAGSAPGPKLRRQRLTEPSSDGDEDRDEDEGVKDGDIVGDASFPALWPVALNAADTRSKWTDEWKRLAETAVARRDGPRMIGARRARQLLDIVAAIGNGSVMDDIAGLKHRVMLKRSENEAQAFFLLAKAGRATSFRGSLYQRIASWWFADTITREINLTKAQGKPSKRKISDMNEDEGSGQATTRVIDKLVRDSCPELKDEPPTSEKFRQTREMLRRWRTKGKIWMELSRLYKSAAVLMIVPSGHYCGPGGRIVSSFELTKMPVAEHHDFLLALSNLRPDIPALLPGVAAAFADSFAEARELGV
ncbi:MAG: hypothetical protein M1814_000921 [Vezdaea aestivalis]|nr:MAG: hypothetical protein M1814_000921 [Vezdaea aestivalis]